MIDLPPIDPAIDVSMATQGMSKGLLQTHGVQAIARPQVSVGPWTAAVQIKNIDSPATDAETQLQLGWHGKIGGFNLNAVAAYKFYLDPSFPIGDRAFELVGTLAHPVGPIELRAVITWSPDDVGSTRRSLLVEGGVSYKLAPSTSLSAGIGRRERRGASDYTAFNTGIAQAIGPVSIEFRYYDTAQSDLGETYQSRAVLLARAKF